jgi:hypothetical protein
MKKIILFSIIAFSCFAYCMPDFADMTGKWKGYLKGPAGDSAVFTYVFKVDGEKLFGTAFGPDGSLPVMDGILKDSLFSFTLIGNRAVNVSGKYFGDYLNMNFDPKGMNLHMTLRRVAD